MAHLHPSASPPLIIRPTRGLAALNLHDLWIYRELVYFMTWRDLKVRYKQTLLGVAWVVLQPVLQTFIFTLLFGRLAGLSTENLPKPLFYFAGILPWGLFDRALQSAGRALVNNRNMLTKVYFPRLVIPLASILASLVDFLISFGVFIALLLYYHLQPTANYSIQLSIAMLTLPLFLLLAMATALGASLWLSAMNVIYRDVSHILPFLANLWFFITPIVYSSREVSANWRLLYSLNPMVGVVDGFRWALLGLQSPGLSIIVSTAVSLALLVSGLFYFRNMERTFADEV